MSCPVKVNFEKSNHVRDAGRVKIFHGLKFKNAIFFLNQSL